MSWGLDFPSTGSNPAGFWSQIGDAIGGRLRDVPLDTAETTRLQMRGDQMAPLVRVLFDFSRIFPFGRFNFSAWITQLPRLRIFISTKWIGGKQQNGIGVRVELQHYLSLGKSINFFPGCFFQRTFPQMTFSLLNER